MSPGRRGLKRWMLVTMLAFLVCIAWSPRVDAQDDIKVGFVEDQEVELDEGDEIKLQFHCEPRSPDIVFYDLEATDGSAKRDTHYQINNAVSFFARTGSCPESGTVGVGFSFPSIGLALQNNYYEGDLTFTVEVTRAIIGKEEMEVNALKTLTITIKDDEDETAERRPSGDMDNMTPPPPLPPTTTPPTTTPPSSGPEEVDPAPEEEAEVDRDALVAIYDAAEGDSWNIKDDWVSMEPIDEWHGVMTDEEERVAELSLSGNNLAGTVAEKMADLEKLKKLDLSDNPDLTGELPSGLADLEFLAELDISGTQLCPPDNGDFRTLLDRLGSAFSGNDSCEEDEPEQTEEPPAGEAEESGGGGCAVASGGAEGSAYSLVFAVFALAAFWGAKGLRARRQYR